MSSSFIEYNNSGFWANDGFVEAAILLLFEETKIADDFDLEWLKLYRKTLALESLPLIYGGMSLRFDEFITTEFYMKRVLTFIENIIERFQNPNYLTGMHLNFLKREALVFLVEIGEFNWNDNEINRRQKDGFFMEDIDQNYYLHGFVLIRKLLLGQIFFKPDSPISYW